MNFNQKPGAGRKMDGHKNSGYEQYFKMRKQAAKKGKAWQESFGRAGHGIWLISISTLLAGGCIWYLLGGDVKAAWWAGTF